MTQDEMLDCLTVARMPDDEMECVIRQLPTLLRGQSLQDQLLLCSYFLGSVCPVVELASKVGLAPEWARAKLREFQVGAQALRDLRQPPHAAD